MPRRASRLALAAFVLLALPAGPAEAEVRAAGESDVSVILEWRPSPGARDSVRVAVPPEGRVTLGAASPSLPAGALAVGEGGWFRRIPFVTVELDGNAASADLHRIELRVEGARPSGGSALRPLSDESATLRGLFANPAAAAGLLAASTTDSRLRPPGPTGARRGELRRRLPETSASGPPSAGGARGFPGAADDHLEARALQGGRVKLAIDRDAIYRVTWEDLDALGVDLAGQRAADLHLVMKGTAAGETDVRLHVEDRDGDGDFEPGDSFVFWGQALTDDWQAGYFQGADTTDVNAYFLDSAPGAWEMATRDATPDPGAPLATDFTETAHAERNTWFKANTRTGQFGTDHFYWCPSLVWVSGEPPATRTENVPLPGLVPARDGLLRVRVLTATSDGTLDPDHRLVLEAGGAIVADATFDGLRVADTEGAIPAARLAADLPVTLSLPGVPGATADRVELDWIEVEYPRGFVAVDEQLEFTHPPGARVSVSGLTQPEVVALDVSDPWNPVRLTGVEIAGGTASFLLGGSGEPRHAVAAFPAGAAGARPASVTWVPDSGLRDPSLAVDLAIVAPRAFLEPPSQALLDYVALRESQGLRVLAVPFESIVDELGGGLFGFPAVSAFLQHAVATWNEPPRWALLVGDTNVDYKNVLGGLNLQPSDCLPFEDTCTPDETAWAQLVPTRVADNPGDLQFLGYYATDIRLSMVAGNDLVPDVTLGRLPVRSRAAMDALLDKIVRYESLGAAPPAWASRVLFTADQFADASERLMEDSQTEAGAEHVTAPYSWDHVFYQSDYAATDQPGFTADLTGRWADPARGAAVVSYVGHGNTFRWSDDRLFLSWDALSCRDDVSLVSGPDAAMPVLLNANCISAGFMHLQNPSLLESLVRAPEGGAIAAYGPTGITDLGVARTIVDTFYAGIHGTSGRGLRLGDVVLQVQVNLGDARAIEELYNNVLLGDPSLRLLVPFGPPALALRAVGGDTRVDLDWDAVAGADEYSVYRSTAATGPWTLVERVPGGTNVLADVDDPGTPVVNGTLYWYALEPHASGWPGRWSEPASARPCTLVPPEPPGTLTATPGAQPGSMTLFWGASPTPSLQGYVLRIYRGTAASGTPERTVQVAGGAYVATGLVPCVTYTFEARALNWCGVESLAGSSATRAAGPCPIAHEVPAFVRDLTVARNGADLVLDWGPVRRTTLGNPFTPTGYVVHRSTDTAFLADAATRVGSPATPGFTDLGRVGNGARLEVYVVAAVDATARTGGLGHDLPQGVRNLAFTDAGGGMNRVTWTPYPYDIQGDFTPLGTFEVHASGTPLSRADCEPPAVPVAVVTTPEALVPASAGSNYFVVAVDVHGNRAAF